MTENKNDYYIWWKQNKPFLSIVPAVIFWVVSVIFFMEGLRFENPIIVMGSDVSGAIAILLSISNTVIQIIGNDQEKEGLGLALWIGWIGSYLLGVGTNIVGLLAILSIADTRLEWIIAIGLGTMIEVLPEKLVVQFLKTWKPKNGKKEQEPVRKPNKPNRYRPAKRSVPDEKSSTDLPPALKRLVETQRAR